MSLLSKIPDPIKAVCDVVAVPASYVSLAGFLQGMAGFVAAVLASMYTACRLWEWWERRQSSKHPEDHE